MMTKDTQDALIAQALSFPDIDGDKPGDVWIKSTDHLDKVNKYRKRVGQPPVVLSDHNAAELVLPGGSK